jgi:hypothetical protein
VLVSLGNPLIVTMGMGQEEATEPAMVAAGIIEYFKIVEAVREALRGDGVKTVFDDGIDVYKIAAMLHEVNQSPLANPIYKKITKLIFDKRIKINLRFEKKIVHRSEPYKIVIGEHRIVRESDE